MKTSNKFTFTRIILAPVICLVYSLPNIIKHFGSGCSNTLSVFSVCLCIVLLAFAEITDYLDGHFARKHHEVSDFGKMFDPFADVFLHLSTFALFMIDGYMPALCFILILYREFSQSFLRQVSAAKGTAVAARKGGKIKTVFYVTSCFVVLLQEFFIRTGFSDSLGINMQVCKYVGYGFFTICVILSYISFIDYLIHFGKILKSAAE